MQKVPGEKRKKLICLNCKDWKSKCWCASDKMLSDIHIYIQDNKSLREMLQRFEWAGEVDGVRQCPVCEGNRPIKNWAGGGHAPECELAKLLSKGVT